jgi:hypothetical protein
LPLDCAKEKIGDLLKCALWLQSLTEGIHTKEALDLVREHVRGIMGPAAVAFSNAMIKMSRLQAAQVCMLALLRDLSEWLP